MLWAVSLVALLLAGAAGLLAWRVRSAQGEERRTPPPAPAGPDPAGMERRLRRDAEAARATDRRALAAEIEALTERVAALEEATRPAPAREGEEAETEAAMEEARVRAALAERGWSEVRVVARGGSGALAVEAVRGGLTAKGWVRPRPDGGLEVDLRPAVRAFP